MVVLIGLVAALLLMLALTFWVGSGILSPLALDTYGSERAGIELVVVPLAAVAGVLARRRLGWVASLHRRRVGPYLPLLTVAVLYGLVAYWAWTFGGPRDTDRLTEDILRDLEVVEEVYFVDEVYENGYGEGGVEDDEVEAVGDGIYSAGHGYVRFAYRGDTVGGGLPEGVRWGLRGLGALLTAGAVFIGISLYPRVFATLAGALGAAAVFAGIVFLSIPVFGSASVERVLTYGEASAYLLPVYFLLTIGLFVAAWVLRAMNPDPPPWTPRAWTPATPPATCPSTLIAAAAASSAGLTLIFIAAGLEAPIGE